MQEIWRRIDAWLSAHTSELLEQSSGSQDVMNPGVTNAEIAEAEKFLGVTFPEDVRACYRIHNGQGQHAPGLFPGGEFLSLKRICDEWGVWKDLLDGGDFKDVQGEPNGPVRDDWWNPAWIPITYDGAGNHYCLDLAPAEGGNAGHILEFWHDDASRTVVATSLTAWLEEFADDLEAGEYVCAVDEYGRIVRKEDVG